MLKYLLDTCVIVDLLRKKSKIDPVFFEKGSSINTITLAELYYGASKSKDPTESNQHVKNLISDFDLDIIDFDKKAGVIFGNLKSRLEATGQRLDDMDILIASTAISEGLVLVTNNIKHFSRINNLKIVSPNKDN